jgi:hypothetical protein
MHFFDLKRSFSCILSFQQIRGIGIRCDDKLKWIYKTLKKNAVGNPIKGGCKIEIEDIQSRFSL